MINYSKHDLEKYILGFAFVIATITGCVKYLQESIIDPQWVILVLGIASALVTRKGLAYNKECKQKEFKKDSTI